LLATLAALALAPALRAQDSVTALSAPGTDVAPIAIVPLDSKDADSAAMVTGALQVSQGRAIIAASGQVTAGSATVPVTLPRRGTLRVCASTTVKLTADNSVPAGDTPGLMMAMDHGAVEASFATGRNADVLMTPDFRILISGPGAVEVKVRLGEHGDTCVDNPGAGAPYVLVSSVFEGGAYRVQPGQRVMFEHGSLRDVVDDEKEPCGCPPPAPANASGNEFPLAQSEGLAPLPKLPPTSSPVIGTNAPMAPPLVYNGQDHSPQPASEAQTPPPPAATQPPTQPQPPLQKKPGFFARIGRFFRRLFGAES
jgi:hypothetical protein